MNPVTSVNGDKTKLKKLALSPSICLTFNFMTLSHLLVFVTHVTNDLMYNRNKNIELPSQLCTLLRVRCVLVIYDIIDMWFSYNR